MTRCLLVCLAALALSATTAWAGPGTYYASPTSSIAALPCDQAHPCTLEYALDQEVSGDTVIAAPGTYHLPGGSHGITEIDGTLEGDPSLPRPVIVQDAAYTNCNCPLLTGYVSAIISHIEIDQETGDAGAIDLWSGSVVTDSILRGGTGEAAYTVGSQTPAPVIRNSLLVGGDFGLNVSGGVSALLQSDTIIATSPAPGGIALNLAGGLGPNGAASVVAQNTIFHGANLDILVDGTEGSATLAAHYSSFRRVPGDLKAPLHAVVFGTDHDQTTVPIFSATPGDYHEAANSPTIDAGSAALDQTTTDLDGLTRVQGAAPDIGAYEATPPPPVVAPVVLPGPVAILAPAPLLPRVTLPSLSAIHVTFTKRRVVVSLKLSGVAATVTVTLTQTITTMKHHKRHTTTRTIGHFTAKLKPGADSVKVPLALARKLATGKVTLSLGASAPSGRSAVSHASITLTHTQLHPAPARAH